MKSDSGKNRWLKSFRDLTRSVLHHILNSIGWEGWRVYHRIHKVLQRAVKQEQLHWARLNGGSWNETWRLEWVWSAVGQVCSAPQSAYPAEKVIWVAVAGVFSQCRLSVGAQVKAALWIPLGGWEGHLCSAELDPTSEWLPEDLAPHWPLAGVQAG